MGNTTTSSAKRDRTYSVDSAYDRRDSSSPRSDDSRTFEFIASTGSTASGTSQPSASGVTASATQSGSGSQSSTKRKPVLCYQSSSEYANDDGPDDYKGRMRTRTISQGTSINENALPTVFKWEGGGKEVYITGTFSEWKPIKMCHSHGDFVAIIDVPEGIHEYKFVVDGQETLDGTVAHDEQNQNNVIHVKKGDFEVFEALAMDLASNNNNNVTGVSGSPPGSYSQELPTSFRQSNESGNSQPIQLAGAGPPILPPHLLQVILNNPTVNFCEPTLLPQPNHVMLNHLYALSIKDGVMVLSATHRYRKKYVTTLLYKPI